MPAPWSPEVLVAALREVLARPGAPSESASDVEVVEQGDTALVRFGWMNNPYHFGIRIPLSDPSEGMWTGEPMDSPESWAGEVSGWLMEELDTGYVDRASRRLGDGCIELSRPTWPSDNRFYLNGCASGDIVWAGRLRLAGEDAMDTDLLQRLTAGGRLVAWVTSHLNTISGGPIVGQAAVSWSERGVAMLDFCQVSDDAPRMVSLSLARAATHIAGEVGAELVVTTVDNADFEILGFRRQADGSSVVDTRFLDENRDGAESLLRESLKQPIPETWQRASQARQPFMRVLGGDLGDI